MDTDIKQELTPLQEHERLALSVRDLYSIMQVVSALRKYRAAVQDLLGSKYQDGEVDACALGMFEDKIQEIEEGINGT
jgi:hypothetical protein